MDQFSSIRDLSVESLRYLSSEQALADLAVFRQGFNQRYQVPDDAKWISFGGSYPGRSTIILCCN